MRPNCGGVTDVIAREVCGLLFETSTEAVFVVDRSTDRIVSANIRAEEMLSREVGSLLGISLTALVCEDRDLRAPGHYEDVALCGGDDYPVYAELNIIHVELAEHGALAVYTARDTTEHRSLQRELVAKHSALYVAHAELERAYAQLGDAKRELEARNQEIALLAWRATMGELVAGIAHHLNNPVGALSSVLRRLHGLAAEAPGPLHDQFAELLTRADRIARRIESNVGAIVEASRASTRAGGRGGVGGVGELPPELAVVLANFAAQLEDLPTKDSP
jgi:signal transduction histidine kinase